MTDGYTHLDLPVPIAVRCLDLDAPDVAQALDDPGHDPGHDGAHGRLGLGENDRRSVAALIRTGRTPLGWVGVIADPREDLAAAVRRAWQESGGAIVRGAVDGSRDAAPRAPADRSRSGQGSRHPTARSRVSVVVTTCADPDAVARCVDSVLTCDGAAPDGAVPLEVIIVENRPAGSPTAAAMHRRFGADPRIRVVTEPKPGLSRARNRGLRAARGEFVAFIDDDVVVDRHWLLTICTELGGDATLACLTGAILPARLDTEAQVLVERFAAYGKGFVRREYSLADAPADQPLFPYTAGHFGSGANAAFRADALRALGGFDACLGAGTRARGGEDLDLWIRLIQARHRLAYEPGLIVWHRHREAAEDLRRQVFGYGVALGAALGKQVLLGSGRWRLLRLAPVGVRYLLDPASRKNAGKGRDFPRALERRERLGMLLGPFAYLASRLERRRESISAAGP